MPGLRALGLGHKVSWARIVRDLYDLHADLSDVRDAYQYLLGDDRVEIVGLDGDEITLWQAKVDAAGVAGDLRVFLSKRRLQKPDDEEQDQSDV